MAEVLVSEFIFTDAPFRSCHASTIVEIGPGRFAAAWFGGSEEGALDVEIWLAQYSSGWGQPVRVAGAVFPCWNPVLHQAPGEDLLLFYKVGPSPQMWWGMVVRSPDGGQSWSEPERLPWIGPVKNKPVRLSNGDLLCPSSEETGGVWTVHMERFSGTEWTRTKLLDNPENYQAIQPTILTHSYGRLSILCRSRNGGIVTSESRDGGYTWSPLVETGLPNPNSGIDAATLRDGRHALVYNPLQRGRSRLALALSNDGVTWKDAVTLENAAWGEFSYPSVIQDQQERLHITYTWNRECIRHVVVAVS